MSAAPAWHAICRELYADGKGMGALAIAAECGKSPAQVYWVLDINNARQRHRDALGKARVRRKAGEPKAFEIGAVHRGIFKPHVYRPPVPVADQEARRQRTMELCQMFAHDEITRAELSLRLRSEA